MPVATFYTQLKAGQINDLFDSSNGHQPGFGSRAIHRGSAQDLYVEYAEALSAVHSATKKITEHEEVNPTGWKIWKRRPAEWTKESDVLYSEYRTARLAVNELERAHPLLADIYAHKGNPLSTD